MGIELEEIEVENLADMKEHTGVDGHLVVYLIEIGAMTTQFVGKPDGCLALLFKFLTDALPNVNHICVPRFCSFADTIERGLHLLVHICNRRS